MSSFTDSKYFYIFRIMNSLPAQYPWHLNGRQAVYQFRLFWCVRFVHVDIPNLIPFLLISFGLHAIIINDIPEIRCRAISWISQPLVKFDSGLFYAFRKTDRACKIQNCCTQLTGRDNYCLRLFVHSILVGYYFFKWSSLTSQPTSLYTSLITDWPNFYNKKIC